MTLPFQDIHLDKDILDVSHVAIVLVDLLHILGSNPQNIIHLIVSEIMYGVINTKL